MYTLEQLCKATGLPEDVTGQVLAVRDFPDLSKLCQEDTWEEGLVEVKKALGDDPKGFQMLACMLRCALDCQADYQALGLSEKIYIDTMACFTRFVGEHLVSFGHYGFDRAFWTVRQISCKLFRMGELEYELVTDNGEKKISLHIPSDADLSYPKLRQSYEDARALLGQHFPEFANGPWVCESWLLSPNLQELLPENAKILGFQRAFQIQAADHDGEFKEWVYKRMDIPDDALPENTSLQRKLKAFLLSGGIFRAGIGTLSEDPFI